MTPQPLYIQIALINVVTRKIIGYKKKYRTIYRHFMILAIFTLIIEAILFYTIYDFRHAPLEPYNDELECFSAHKSKFCCDKEPSYMSINTTEKDASWVYVTQCKRYSYFGNWS